MFNEIYDAVRRFFTGPVISGANTSIPYQLSEFVSDMNLNKIKFTQKCYGVKVNNCYLITYDDNESEVKDNTILGSCYIHGEEIRYIAMPLYNAIKKVSNDTLLMNIALVSIYTVVSCIDPISYNSICSILPDNDCNNHLRQLINLAPFTIFVNVANRLLQNDMYTEDQLVETFKQTDFSEIKEGLLYGHKFKEFFSEDILSFVGKIIDTMQDFYQNYSNGNETYISKYLDNSAILPVYYNYIYKRL